MKEFRELLVASFSLVAYDSFPEDNIQCLPPHLRPCCHRLPPARRDLFSISNLVFTPRNPSSRALLPFVFPIFARLSLSPLFPPRLASSLSATFISIYCAQGTIDRRLPGEESVFQKGGNIEIRVSREERVRQLRAKIEWLPTAGRLLKLAQQFSR